MADELYLVLGCFGRRDDNFVSCRAIENRILKIDVNLDFYDKICNYLESVRLFDKPLFDLNGIRHVIYNLQDRYDQKIKRLWSEKEYQLFERFIVNHRTCGLYLKLITVCDDEVSLKQEEEKLLVSAAPERIKSKHEHLMLVKRHR